MGWPHQCPGDARSSILPPLWQGRSLLIGTLCSTPHPALSPAALPPAPPPDDSPSVIRVSGQQKKPPAILPTRSILQYLTCCTDKLHISPDQLKQLPLGPGTQSGAPPLGPHESARPLLRAALSLDALISVKGPPASLSPHNNALLLSRAHNVPWMIYAI